MMDDLIAWLREQLDDDERWARAACQAYPYATDKTLPESGVHWTWVTGEDWEPVKPNPAIDEFVAPAGESCNLATIEQWSRSDWGIEGATPRLMPRVYANEIVEMNASAAGHIARWDPARVLAEVDVKRRILDELLALPHYAWDGRSEYGCPKFEDPEVWAEIFGDQAQQCNCGRDAHVDRIIRLLALLYAHWPGYRQEWRP